MSNQPESPSPGDQTQPAAGRQLWLILLVVGLGMVSCLLASTSFNVAVPALMAHFGLGQSQVQWAVTAFIAAMTVGMLPTVWLVRRLGLRALFLGAISVMAAAGTLGYFASEFWAVVVLRAIQGVAAGILQPLGTIAVMALVPPERRGNATGLLSFGIILAPALAPSLSGVLLDRFGWSAIFLLNLPACLLAAALGVFFLPGPRAWERRSFDWIGLGLLTILSLALVEGLASLQHSGVGSLWTWLFIGLVPVSLIGFLVHAGRTRHPILSLGAFADRSFTLGTLVTFAYGFGLYASTYLIPVFLQQALHFTATAAGTMLMPSGLMLAATIPVAGRLADRVSPVRVTMCGLALFFFSFVYLALWASRVGTAEIVGATIVGRIGLGLLLPALTIATLRNLQRSAMSEASVLTNYVRQIGCIMGVAIAATFVAGRQDAYAKLPDGIMRAYSEGFVLVAAMFLIALLAAAFMHPRRP